VSEEVSERMNGYLRRRAADAECRSAIRQIINPRYAGGELSERFLEACATYLPLAVALEG
jgi:hypothetical protein